MNLIEATGWGPHISQVILPILWHQVCRQRMVTFQSPSMKVHSFPQNPVLREMLEVFFRANFSRGVERVQNATSY